MEELGALLHEARKEKGLSLEDMEKMTRIRPDFLVAIEEGNPEKVPGEAYFRAFIRSYAKAVDLNPDEIIGQYDLAKHPQQENARPSLRERREATKRKRLKLLLVVAILSLLGGFGYWLWLQEYLSF